MRRSSPSRRRRRPSLGPTSRAASLGARWPLGPLPPWSWLAWPSSCWGASRRELHRPRRPRPPWKPRCRRHPRSSSSAAADPSPPADAPTPSEPRNSRLGDQPRPPRRRLIPPRRPEGPVLRLRHTRRPRCVRARRMHRNTSTESRGVAFVLAAALIVTPAAAFADPKPEVAKTDAAKAEELKKSGHEAMENFQYAQAADFYQRSYALSKNPILLLQPRPRPSGPRRFSRGARLARTVPHGRFGQGSRSRSARHDAPGVSRPRSEPDDRVQRSRSRGSARGQDPRDDAVRQTDHPQRRDLRAHGQEGRLPSVRAKARAARRRPRRSRARPRALRHHRDARHPGERCRREHRGRRQDDRALTDRGARASRHPRSDCAKSGWSRGRTVAVVGASEHKDVVVPMEKDPSLLSRWWFWTAVGSAIAVGVVSTIVLTTEKDADQGTLSPGQIAAPLRF